MDEEPDNAGVKFPPPLIFAGTLALGLAADRLITVSQTLIPKTASTSAAALFALGGLFLIAVSLGMFKKTRNAPEPWKPVDSFIAEGIYRYSRNPMYLGMSATYLAITAHFQSAGAAVFFIPLLWMITHFVIKPEEAYLARQFGQTYLDYKTRVRRWV